MEAADSRDNYDKGYPFLPIKTKILKTFPILSSLQLRLSRG